MLGMELETTRVAATATVDFPQLGLQVQAPDLRIISQLVTMHRQAFNDGIEDGFSHERTMKRALGLDCRRLLTGHAGGKQQGPHARIPG
ncbi:hypothetical protein D3C76_1454400 [compost metagenome]